MPPCEGGDFPIMAPQAELLAPVPEQAVEQPRVGNMTFYAGSFPLERTVSTQRAGISFEAILVTGAAGLLDSSGQERGVITPMGVMAGRTTGLHQRRMHVGEGPARADVLGQEDAVFPVAPGAELHLAPPQKARVGGGVRLMAGQAVARFHRNVGRGRIEGRVTAPAEIPGGIRNDQVLRPAAMGIVTGRALRPSVRIVNRRAGVLRFMTRETDLRFSRCRQELVILFWAVQGVAERAGSRGGRSMNPAGFDKLGVATGLPAVRAEVPGRHVRHAGTAGGRGSRRLPGTIRLMT